MHLSQHEAGKPSVQVSSKPGDGPVPSVQQAPHQLDGCGRDSRLAGTEHQADPGTLSPSPAGERGSGGQGFWLRARGRGLGC